MFFVCLTVPELKRFLEKMVSKCVYYLSLYSLYVYMCVLFGFIYCTLLVDETIGDVLTTLKARSVPYTAVYTGLSPSHVRQHHTNRKHYKTIIQIQLQALL